MRKCGMPAAMQTRISLIDVDEVEVQVAGHGVVHADELGDNLRSPTITSGNRRVRRRASTA